MRVGRGGTKVEEIEKERQMSSPVTAIVAKRNDCREVVYDKKKRDSDET